MEIRALVVCRESLVFLEVLTRGGRVKPSDERERRQPQNTGYPELGRFVSPKTRLAAHAGSGERDLASLVEALDGRVQKHDCSDHESDPVIGGSATGEVGRDGSGCEGGLARCRAGGKHSTKLHDSGAGLEGAGRSGHEVVGSATSARIPLQPVWSGKRWHRWRHVLKIVGGSLEKGARSAALKKPLPGCPTWLRCGRGTSPGSPELLRNYERGVRRAIAAS